MILWAAWLRVDRWYRTGNLAPQPELARWRLHPEAQLRVLRNELRNSTWKPTSWPQVPYPKKGASLRHYVMPSIKDQVAFMAYLVLLAPLFERRFRSFVFGNRWYRPMYWNRRLSSPRWELLPYPLFTPRIYRSYAQSFGLFRRVAHWTVARMTDTDVSATDYGGRVQRPCDYSDRMLPPWTRPPWWQQASRRRACWTALDLQLAYPSVELSVLRDSMECLLDAEDQSALLPESGPPHFGTAVPLCDSVSGYPSPILAALSDRTTRLSLASNLVTALEQVVVDSRSIAQCMWHPRHARPTLPPSKDYGLPTGLAVSGILLNVVLSSADDLIFEYLESENKQEPGAIVRFADDVYLMSTTYDGLFALTEQFWKALSRNENPTLASPSSRTNLYIGLTKIRPIAVQQAVHEFLRNNQWTPCEEDGVKCSELMPPKENVNLTTLSRWWKHNNDKNDSRLAPLRSGLERAIVLSNNLGPFVTALVERLSDIGTDTLADRFGVAAASRLERLHELARFDIDDEQVRADTRRTFAANRLVRMWLPSRTAPDGIREIRSSVAHVLQLTPWKHALWRAVVRASALRPHGQRSDNERQSDNDRSSRWLESQLARIAMHRGGKESMNTAWAHTWPEACVDEAHEMPDGWRDLYLSYHRTVFWHHLSDTLAQLWRHIHASSSNRPEHSEPSPHWWSTRAIPDGDHRHVVQFLAAVDRWVEVLYPGSPRNHCLEGWELDQLCVAVLASRPRSAVAGALRSCREPDSKILRVPPRLGSGVESAIQLLSINGRVLPAIDGDTSVLGRDGLAHVALGGQDRQLGQQLFGKNAKRLDRTLDYMFIVSAGSHLGCADYIRDDTLWRIVDDDMPVPAKLAEDPTTLLEYHRVRRAAVGRPRRTGNRG